MGKIVGGLGILKWFFTHGRFGRSVPMAEIKALSADDRKEMIDDTVALLGLTPNAQGKFEEPDPATCPL